jgi:hypothetical protein
MCSLNSAVDRRDDNATSPGAAMTVFTILELEFLTSLRRRWSALYANELTALLRELDEPYLLRPRMARRRLRRGVSRRVGRRH